MLYEKRTYDVRVGQMPEARRLYETEGWPAMEGGDFAKHSVGYFVSDTGPLHQLIHIWRFEDDAERRAFWARLYKDDAFMAFAGKLRPLLNQQHVQLMLPAGWGPQP